MSYQEAGEGRRFLSMETLTEIRARHEEELMAAFQAQGGAIVSRLASITEAWAEKEGYNAPRTYPGLSERGAAVQQFFDENHFEPEALNTQMAKFAACLLGEGVEIVTRPGSVSSFSPGVVIVPLARRNGHNYDVGAPAVCYSGDVFLSKDRALHAGNRMEAARNSLRPATLLEIKSLVDNILVRGSSAEIDFLGDL
jgi:hypothetical protein